VSHDLFKLHCGELILRHLVGEGAFRIGENITNVRYADETVLIAESQSDLQRLLDVVVEESAKRHLSINCKKAECLVVSKKGTPACSLKIGGENIKQVSSFTYLGSLLTDDARCIKEIERRLALVRNGNVAMCVLTSETCRNLESCEM